MARIPSAKRKQSSKCSAAKASPSAHEKLTVAVPAYLLDAMRIQAAKDRSSIRYILLRALRDAGFVIKPHDIFANGRRTQGRVSS